MRVDLSVSVYLALVRVIISQRSLQYTATTTTVDRARTSGGGGEGSAGRRNAQSIKTQCPRPRDRPPPVFVQTVVTDSAARAGCDCPGIPEDMCHRRRRRPRRAAAATAAAAVKTHPSETPIRVVYAAADDTQNYYFYRCGAIILL